MSPILVAAIVAVAIVALVVGGSVFGDALTQRNDLIREQQQRAYQEQQADRARSNYERDIGYIASIFDPLGLFH